MAAFLSSAGVLARFLASTGTAAASLARMGPAAGSVLTGLTSLAKCGVASVVGGVVFVGAVPVTLSALGFTGAGIAASSLAAKMMSASAIANGGGVAAGSLVATLQSIGAAGLSVPTKIILGTIGSRVGAWVSVL